LEADISITFVALFRDLAEVHIDLKVIVGLVVLIILLFISALMSGSEVAFFSLRPEDIEKLKANKSRKAAMVLKLCDSPDTLLSTILVANNTVNIAAVLLAAFISSLLFDFSGNPLLGLILEVLVITFIILLFGEVIPKMFATRKQLPLSLFMAYPMAFLIKFFKPVTSLLIFSASFVKKRTGHRQSKISMDNLSEALDLASDNINEDEKILKGIVNFGNINVSEIMCPRIDVTAINIQSGFNRVKSTIIESGFSRIPVYAGTFDSVKGILYAKDILQYINNPDTFKWQSLMRPVHFVPETKKINELLKEFQIKKIHMAVVIDEYGGTSGIITLEDVLEEIVGEITDESDEDETMFRQIDDKTYVFEGKILLNDFFKIINVEDDPFEDVRGESETLAGLILELRGEIPQKGQVITYRNFEFIIESADKRRIKEIRVEISDDYDRTNKE
jgi:gliding motility-associated protein GldE